MAQDVVKARDPKGLYKKVAEGKIKGFTGIDSPYEAPLAPEVHMLNHQLGIQKCVDMLVFELRKRGFLSGAPDASSGLTAPDGGKLVNMVVPEDQLAAKKAEAATLPQVPLTDLDVNWLQVVAEGWAAPLKGFMREGTLVQTLHFNSMLVDQDNFTGMGGYVTSQTNWMQETFPTQRVSMPIPIVLPVTDFTRRSVGKAKAVALTNSAGVPLAILRSPEIYELRVRELILRTWGVVDDEHPYIKELLAPGKDYACGGEVELLGRLKYNDGLDQFRLSVEELRAAFKAKGADTVYAFQTRNPTHAGHAFLMKDSRRKLMEKGFKNPVHAWTHAYMHARAMRLRACIHTRMRTRACIHTRNACAHTHARACIPERMANPPAALTGCPRRCVHADTHTRMHACTHTRAHMHAHMHARMHACTHARTHTVCTPRPMAGPMALAARRVDQEVRRATRRARLAAQGGHGGGRAAP